MVTDLGVRHLCNITAGDLCLLIQPLLHLLEPFFVHGRGVNDFQ
jgi:hypothetical protein